MSFGIARFSLLAAGVFLAVLGGGCSGPHGTSLAGIADGDDASISPPGDEAVMTFGDDASSGVGPEAGCATASAEAKRQPVYLLFVLDGSGSMNASNKWASVRPALASIFGAMQSSGDTGVGAGLTVFSDTLDPTYGNGPYPTPADVPIAFVDSAQQAALGARLTGQASGGTPTHAALKGGYAELEGYSPASPLQPGGKKVLILITDGVPSDDCMTTSFFGFANYMQNTCVMEAGQELAQAGIQTFVIGVGDFALSAFFGLGGIDPQFLGYLAQAGGTGPVGCKPSETWSPTDLCYFEIDPSKAQTATQLQQEFVTALDAIRGQAISCTFPLETTHLGQVDPHKVNVQVGGATVLQDPKDGWTYDDPNAPTEIILHGASCTSAQADVTAKVSIVLGCATQTK